MKPPQLRVLNTVAAVLLAIQAIVILLLSSSSRGSVPVTTNFLAQDKLSSSVAGHPVLVGATRHLFDLNLAYLIAFILLLSAVYHALAASSLQKAYNKALTTGVSSWRWLEYGVIFGLLSVVVAQLVGVFDAPVLFMVLGLILFMALVNMNIEGLYKKAAPASWFSYWLGLAAGLLSWLVIVIYALASYGFGNLPTFTYWLLLSMLVLFYGFSALTYMYFKKSGNWKDYMFTERAYLVLIFIAQTALAWQVFFGILKK